MGIADGRIECEPIEPKSVSRTRAMFALYVERRVTTVRSCWSRTETKCKGCRRFFINGTTIEQGIYLALLCVVGGGIYGMYLFGRWGLNPIDCDMKNFSTTPTLDETMYGPRVELYDGRHDVMLYLFRTSQNLTVEMCTQLYLCDCSGECTGPELDACQAGVKGGKRHRKGYPVPFISDDDCECRTYHTGRSCTLNSNMTYARSWYVDSRSGYPSVIITVSNHTNTSVVFSDEERIYGTMVDCHRPMNYVGLTMYAMGILLLVLLTCTCLCIRGSLRNMKCKRTQSR
jgi:hypothetical protein